MLDEWAHKARSFLALDSLSRTMVSQFYSCLRLEDVDGVTGCTWRQLLRLAILQ